jgi:hypothetical protein
MRWATNLDITLDQRSCTVRSCSLPPLVPVTRSESWRLVSRKGLSFGLRNYDLNERN